LRKKNAYDDDKAMKTSEYLEKGVGNKIQDPQKAA